LGVKEGQKVITTPITFAASANCVRYCGGEVVFADIDPETYLIDIKQVKKLLEGSPKGTYSGIIPVDFAGRSVDMEAFHQLANEYDLWIIEDACHAPGAFFQNSEATKIKSGSGKYANLAIFSFHPVKHIACGEGGMVTTNDEALYHKLMMLRTHGITRNTNEFTNTLEFANGTTSHDGNWPGWYMEMQELGYNYRLTDIQAALGASQLKRADLGLKRRREIAAKYHLAFENMGQIKGHSKVVEGHAYHLYIIEVEDRLALYNYLKTQNIFPQIHYIPAHLMPYYRQFGWTEGNMPKAERYYGRCLSLPMYPSMSEEEQKFVIAKIKEFYL